MEVDARFVVGDAFGYAPTTEADHRLAASQRLDRYDAEVLDARKDERAASLVEVQQLLIGYMAEQRHVGRDGTPQVVRLRAGAGHDKASIARSIRL